MDLGSRVAIVTGAGSGIGRAAAVLFHRHGADVCLVGRSRAGVAETQALLDGPGEALVQILDVADESAVEAMVSECKAQLGTPDVLFSNAGVILIKPAIEHTVADWERMLAVNVIAGFVLARALIPGMQRLGRGSIVFNASIDSAMGDYQVAAYCASKGATMQLARALALEHAKDNIRVNAVSPGITATPMQMSVIDTSDDPREALVARNRLTPIGRMLRPEEIAEAALFLASDRSSGITGQAIVVDGGITTAWMNPPAEYLPAEALREV